MNVKANEKKAREERGGVGQWRSAMPWAWCEFLAQGLGQDAVVHVALRQTLQAI